MYNNIYGNDSYLAHYGVLGMKWGVRRYQNADGSLTAKGKVRYLKSDGSHTAKGAKISAKINKNFKKADAKTIKKMQNMDSKIEVYNKATEKFNPKLHEINSKYSDNDIANNSKIGKKYQKEVADAWEKAYADSNNEYVANIIKNDKNFKKGMKLIEKYNALEWDQNAKKSVDELKSYGMKF